MKKQSILKPHPSRVPYEPNKCYSKDGKHYELDLADLVANESLAQGDFIYEAHCKWVTPDEFLSADDILDEAREKALDNGCRVDDDFLLNLNFSDISELQNLIDQWIEKRNIRCNWFKAINIVKRQLTEGDFL